MRIWFDFLIFFPNAVWLQRIVIEENFLERSTVVKTSKLSTILTIRGGWCCCFAFYCWFLVDGYNSVCYIKNCSWTFEFLQIYTVETVKQSFLQKLWFSTGILTSFRICIELTGYVDFFVIVLAVLHDSALSPIFEIKNQCITILFVCCCHLSSCGLFLHLFLYTVETAIFGFGRGELLFLLEREL